MNWFPNWLTLDLFQKLSAIVAYVLGASWVVMNYLRNRTHVPRLQVEVRIEPVDDDETRFVLVTCQARNAGLSKVNLRQKKAGAGLRGTALLIRMLPSLSPETQIFEVPWDTDSAAFDVFAGHEAIEPGLTISEQKLIHLPRMGYAACWAQLRISAGGEQWSAIAVALLEGAAQFDSKG
jgi:hypothetical protein